MSPCFLHSLVEAKAPISLVWRGEAALGETRPLTIPIFCTLQEGLTDADLVKIVLSNWDLRPGAIVKGESIVAALQDARGTSVASRRASHAAPDHRRASRELACVVLIPHMSLL